MIRWHDSYQRLHAACGLYVSRVVLVAMAMGGRLISCIRKQPTPVIIGEGESASWQHHADAYAYVP